MADSLVVSTRNQDKLAELRVLLAGLPYELLTAEACGVPEVEETGTTLRENAALKARAAFEQTGLACLADDTGLCVDALGGEQGLLTQIVQERPHVAASGGRLIGLLHLAEDLPFAQHHAVQTGGHLE